MKILTKEERHRYYMEHREHIRKYQNAYNAAHRNKLREKARAKYAEKHDRKYESKYTKPPKPVKPLPNLEKARSLFKEAQTQAHFDWIVNNKMKMKGNANG